MSIGAAPASHANLRGGVPRAGSMARGAAPSLPSTVPASDLSFTWTQLTGLPSPGPRVDAGLVYDSTDGYLLLFGGEHYGTIPTSYWNDTWTFSGGRWTNVTDPTDAPPQSTGFMMADDPSDDSVVLFGGLSATDHILDATWTYSAGVWTNITASIGAAPPPTYWGSMAYDNATGTVILFGGSTGFTSSQDYTNATWSFNGDRWTQLTPTTLPSARISASLTYDPDSDALLLFGGMNYTVPELNDTWTLSGGTWTEVAATGAPSPVWGAGITYDPAAGAVVVYAGTPAENYDVYTYASGVWTAYNAEPSPGQTIGQTLMAYDYSDGYALLVQETTSYENLTWALSVTSSSSGLSVLASASPQSGPAPLEVAFSSSISGGTPPYTITWQFGDGSTSVTGSPATAGNTSHTYATPGAYRANLTVVDSASHTFSLNWTIEVTTAPLSVTISGQPSPVAPNATVSFVAIPSGGTPPYTYDWTFGDGGTATTQNATHAYVRTGVYEVELVVSDEVHASVSRFLNITVSISSTPVGAASTGWYYYAAGAAAAAVVVLLLVVLLRRRKSAPPPPVAPGPGAPPGAG